MGFSMSATAADDVKRLTGLDVVVTARQRAQWLQPLLAGESVVGLDHIALRPRESSSYSWRPAALLI
jgi:hypothetical protein